MVVKSGTKKKLMILKIEEEYAHKLANDRKWDDVKILSPLQIGQICEIDSATSQKIHQVIVIESDFENCLSSSLAFINGRKNLPRNNKYVDGEYLDLEEDEDGSLTWRGRFAYINGLFYEGEWKDAKPHGLGVMSYPDGRVLEGGWADGSPHGWLFSKQLDGKWYWAKCKHGELEPCPWLR